MVRKQRTKIAGTDPNYHSELPRRPITTETPAPKPASQPTASEAAAPPRPRRETPPKPKPSQKPAKPKTEAPVQAQPAPTREIHLTAAIKREHSVLIEKLAAKGIDRKVPVKLAGRKAVQLFKPKREFIEKADADRMPLREGYQTTKRVDSELIDHLRTENDPFGLSSDTAMLRGQFEPLFWKCLDEVLKELSSK